MGIIAQRNMTQYTRVEIIAKTLSEFQSENPVIPLNTIAVISGDGRFCIGDGVTKIKSLPFFMTVDQV